MNNDTLHKAAQAIAESKFLTAFTGAGISVESGIQPFRGEDGLWSKVDPKFFDLDFFMKNPEKSWSMRETFFKDILNAAPNQAHLILAELENQKILKAIITQNIDNLHQKAGNQNVYEFHGNSREAVCMKCGEVYEIKKLNLQQLPPLCSKCGGVLKPDFVFFGEPIPRDVFETSFELAQKSDVMLIIGTTGIVYPASGVPITAKQSGALLIEINIAPSEYTSAYTDYFLKGKATEVMTQLFEEIKKVKPK